MSFGRPLGLFTFLFSHKKSKIRNIANKIVFFNSTGQKIDASKLRKVFKKVLKKAGIEDFRFHDLRHTFATRIAQAGIDIYRIAKLLGHKDIRITQRYSHHCPDSLRSSVAVLDNGYKSATVVYNSTG